MVTLTATSQADATKTATAVITVVTSTGSIQVAVSPGGLTLLPGSAAVQFSANVIGSSVTTVNWSVTGPGTVDGTGKYTPPATLATTSTVLVTATATADGTTKNSAVVTVSGADNQNSKLTGQYAFQFSGFDSNGPYIATGSLVLNGTTGAISGTEDLRIEGGASVGTYKQLAVTGTYVVMPAATGVNRGSMTLTSAQATNTFRFVVNAAGNARLQEFDDGTDQTGGLQGAGVLLKQDATKFSLAASAGSYSFLLNAGEKAGSGNLRSSVAGRFDVSSTGVYSNGIIDLAQTNKALNQGGPVTGLPTTGTLGDVTGLSTSGRYEASFTPQGLGGSANFVFYIVSSTQMLMMDVDAAGAGTVQPFVGLVAAQSGTYNTGSVAAQNVFQLTGYDVSASTNQPVTNTTLGLLLTNGSGALSTGSVLDQNSDGGIIAQTAITGTYTMGANGRGTLAYTTGAISGTFIVYMYGTNSAFLMDASTGTANDVQTGTLEAQTGGPFAATSVSGNYTLSWLPGIAEDVKGPSGSVVMDGVNGWNGVIDEINNGLLNPDSTVSGTYTVSANGRGTLNVNAGGGGGGGGTEVFYSVSPSKAYMISGSGSDTHSPVLVVEK
jgi:hypothetical protein